MTQSIAKKLATIVFVCALAMNTMTVSGCAKWKVADETPTSNLGLSQGKLPPDSVQLELNVIKVDPANIDLENQAWGELHPQGIDLATRKNLAANGIRCGVASSSLPLKLQTLIEEHDLRRKSEETQAESLMSEETGAQQMQVRSGQATHIVLSAALEKMSWVVNDDGYLYGRESFNARCQCTMKARPTGDGTVRLELVPEITHGIPQQRVGVGNNALIYEMAQDRHVLDPLKIVTNLRPGQWLVLGCTEQVTGIADTFFCETKGEGGLRKIVLIRISESQPESLFDRDQIVKPIVTPTD